MWQRSPIGLGYPQGCEQCSKTLQASEAYVRSLDGTFVIAVVEGKHHYAFEYSL